MNDWLNVHRQCTSMRWNSPPVIILCDYEVCVNKCTPAASTQPANMCSQYSTPIRLAVYFLHMQTYFGHI